MNIDFKVLTLIVPIVQSLVSLYHNPLETKITNT